jgi:signal transduction histidine kinase
MSAGGAALLAPTVANRSLRQLVATPVTLILAGLLLVGALAAVALLIQYGVKSFAVGSEALLPWVWAGFGLFWLTLAVWLWDALNSARRLALALHERQLAIQSMEHAVGTKHAFLRMVDYELRSPLQIIVTSAESLAHDFALAQSRPRTPIAVRRIQHAAAALQFRLRDLLETMPPFQTKPARPTRCTRLVIHARFSTRVSGCRTCAVSLKRLRRPKT